MAHAPAAASQCFPFPAYWQGVNNENNIVSIGGCRGIWAVGGRVQEGRGAMRWAVLMRGALRLLNLVYQFVNRIRCTDRREKVCVDDLCLMHLLVFLPRLLVFCRYLERLVRPIPMLGCGSDRMPFVRECVRSQDGGRHRGIGGGGECMAQQLPE